MNCLHCNAQNPEDAMFCGECGRRFGEDLPQAQASPAPDPPPPVPPLPPTADPGPAGYSAGPATIPLAPPPSMGGYVQHTNTSGTGPQAILPDEANGWTFAGCLPFGLYAFSHNMAGWGALSCLGTVIPPLHWVYCFVIGASGRQMAWKMRQFKDIESYQGTMQAWNIAGMIWLGISIMYWIAMGLVSSFNPDSSTNLLNIIQ
ncbi:MAG: zinc ribbon domain-containing protein [bacterium]